MLLILSFILPVMFLLTACGQEEKEDPLVMGFVPLVDADTLIESIDPLADILHESMGREVESFTATNYVGVVEGLGSGQVDFGIIPPFAYALAHKESGAEVILTALDEDGSSGYTSIILVGADSDIEDIQDLKGKNIAFVDPSSTSGYLFPGAHLIENGIDLEQDLTYQYSGGHDKSLQLLLNGDVDAIATFEHSLNRYEDEFPGAKAETREIARTDQIPGVSVTVEPNMDEETKQELIDTLTGLNDLPEAKALMVDLFNIHGFREATAADYEIINTTAKVMDVDLEEE